MRGREVVFSTGKDNWQTPIALFQTWNRIYCFTNDVAADSNSALCNIWYGPGAPEGWENALTVPWGTRNWCNPPYSKVKEFTAKAAAEAQNGSLTVMLLPARTDTRWFHDHIYRKPNVTVDFIKGRVKFVNPDGPLRAPTASVIEGRHAPNNSAPFPSMIVTFFPL